MARSYVLRKQPGGTLLPSAHAVDREFRVISALHGSAVPGGTAAVLLCSDPAVIGTMFYLMELRRRPHLLGSDAARHDARRSARRSTTR